MRVDLVPRVGRRSARVGARWGMAGSLHRRWVRGALLGRQGEVGHR
jgi:hypothetical protein